jgi:hypothetical protein
MIENKKNEMLRNKRTKKLKEDKNKRRRRSRCESSDEEEYLTSSSHDVESFNSKIVGPSEEEIEMGSEKEIEKEKEEIENMNQPEYMDDNGAVGDPSGDVILEGNLIYRFTINQIELDGNWSISTDNFTKERLSYLFQKSNEFLECNINFNDITSDNSEIARHNYINICAANLFECIVINKQYIFNSILDFLSGEYAGYFMYYGKTIEDRLNLNLLLEDSLVRVTGNLNLNF